MALTRKVGYPQYREDKAGLSLVDVYMDTWAEIVAYQALIGSPSVDNPRYALDSTTRRRRECGTMGEIEFVYVPMGTAQAGIDTNKPEPSCQVSLFERPLEDHPSYLNKWNYHLGFRNDAAFGTPPFWDTSGGVGQTKFANNGEPEKYRWIKEPSELPQEAGYIWNLIPKTKPGIESYLSPSVVVSMKYLYSSYAKASTASADAGKRQTPEYTFGRTGGEWLNMGATVYKDGRKWVMETSWQFSESNGAGEGWDNELYPNEA